MPREIVHHERIPAVRHEGQAFNLLVSPQKRALQYRHLAIKRRAQVLLADIDWEVKLRGNNARSAVGMGTDPIIFNVACQ